MRKSGSINFKNFNDELKEIKKIIEIIGRELSEKLDFKFDFLVWDFEEFENKNVIYVLFNRYLKDKKEEICEYGMYVKFEDLENPEKLIQRELKMLKNVKENKNE